jgi:hypothetical protein
MMPTAVRGIKNTEPDTTTQHPEMAIATAILSLSLSAWHDTAPAMSLTEMDPACMTSMDDRTLQ